VIPVVPAVSVLVELPVERVEFLDGYEASVVLVSVVPVLAVCDSGAVLVAVEVAVLITDTVFE
jgi:hypothetical protein